MRERKSENVETAKRFFDTTVSSLKSWIQKFSKTAVIEACRQITCVAPLLRIIAEFVR